MSNKGFMEWRDIRKKIAMGVEVGRIEEFKSLKESACVHVEQREDIAWCKIYQLVNPDDKELNSFLEEVAIPALKELGRARWYRTEVTDLALAKSYIDISKQHEDAKNVLDDE